MPRKISLLTLLTWLRKLRPMPDWFDAVVTRVWLLKLLEIVDELAADTVTLFDDKLLFIVHRVVDNEVTWVKFHALILDLVQNEPSTVVTDALIIALAKAACAE